MNGQPKRKEVYQGEVPEGADAFYAMMDTLGTNYDKDAVPAIDEMKGVENLTSDAFVDAIKKSGGNSQKDVLYDDVRGHEMPPTFLQAIYAHDDGKPGKPATSGVSITPLKLPGSDVHVALVMAKGKDIEPTCYDDLGQPQEPQRPKKRATDVTLILRDGKYQVE
jgi:hypothetical protein